MLAETLVEKLGEDTVGRTVMTFPFGAWPGGLAIVTELQPDDNAPEIVFNVRGIGREVQDAIKAGELDDAEIGVFENEEVVLMY